MTVTTPGNAEVAKEATLQTISVQLDIPLSTLQRTRSYEQTFEDGTTDTTTNNATQTVQQTTVYGGTYSLQVTINASQTGYVETPKRPVSANQQVTFSFAHKEDANITALNLVVVWYRASGTVISTNSYSLTPSSTWTVDTRTVSAPQNATDMALRIEGTAGASSGNVYIDDITIDLVGQIFQVDGSGQLKVTDTDLLAGLEPKRTSATQQLTSQSIAASGTSSFTLTGLDGYSATIVTVKAVYDALATSGVRVRWLYSPDGTNFDSSTDAEEQGNYEDVSFIASGTRQRTIVVPLLTDNVKVQVVNQDTSYSVTVDAWSILIR